MSDAPKTDDELAGTEQPFVQHLMELRDRLVYVCRTGGCMIAGPLARPSGLIDLIAVPIRATCRPMPSSSPWVCSRRFLSPQVLLMRVFDVLALADVPGMVVRVAALQS